MTRKLGILCVALLLFLGVSGAKAQGAPSDGLIDRIFADLSARIGRQIGKSGMNGRWEYSGIVVTDNNLGCQNGQSNAPGQTRAWVFTINLTDYGTYEYRASVNEAIFFLCSGTGVGVPSTGGTLPPAPPSGLVSGAPIPPEANYATTSILINGATAAYIGRDGNVYLIGVRPTQTQPVPITGDAAGKADLYWSVSRSYTHLTWAPNGGRLAFVEATSGTLYTVASGELPRQVATGIVPVFPPSWSPDGSEIAYAVNTGQSVGNSPDVILQIQAVPAAGGAPRVVGQLAFGIGCGGGGFNPATILYFNEAGYNYSQTLFKWTASGFLHTLRCTGEGLALTNFAGQRVWETLGVWRSVLAFDETKIVALQYLPQTNTSGSVVIIGTANGSQTLLPTPQQADQVAWSGDGNTVLYSTRTLASQLQLNPNTGVEFATGESYTLGLYAIPAVGGAAVPLFSGEGFAIGRISTNRTSALIFFSVIESELNLVARANAGDSQANVIAAAPRVKSALAVLTGEFPPFFIGSNAAYPTLSNSEQYNAVPTAVQAVVPAVVPTIAGTSGDNPLGLMVGGRAYVPPGGNVNLRNNPSAANPNNVKGILRPGDVVVIVAGPVFTENLRWWEVRREADNFQGWVVDQYINSSGQVENNLLPLR